MEALLNEFVQNTREILDDNLVGIYLHGSYVMGCFNPKKSDLDFIIVVNEKMDDASKRAFMDMVTELNERGPAKGLEMSIVTKDVCKPFVYPTPFELHFSVMHLGWYRDNPEDYIQKMNGTDKDLAAHFTIIGKRGKCLHGQSIEDVFAEVPQKDYIDAIWDDISEAPEDIENNTMYITLNLVRVLAYKKEQLVLSKKEGGDWGIKNLPQKYHTLICDALREYSDGVDVTYDLRIAREYAEYMTNSIK
ncbi:aminoglycoside adenylyltransferase domain-containing protein [Butyrivibrio sp. XPD2002]|uniref:aminoglycoside adenylyltransferase domain-containing protein n=1 Tax=Butyrivibrio sp. XPD2002 TaxID=1280665 RepID=UPI0004076BFE|nr:aminoglycoside adenylyltransferase domain-containing protein [Butyrivibrio sp. XPD2002]